MIPDNVYLERKAYTAECLTRRIYRSTEMLDEDFRRTLV